MSIKPDKDNVFGNNQRSNSNFVYDHFHSNCIIIHSTKNYQEVYYRSVITLIKANSVAVICEEGSAHSYAQKSTFNFKHLISFDHFVIKNASSFYGKNK